MTAISKTTPIILTADHAHYSSTLVHAEVDYGYRQSYLDELENDLEKEDGEQDTDNERQRRARALYRSSCGPCTLLTAQNTRPRNEAMGLGSINHSF